MEREGGRRNVCLPASASVWADIAYCKEKCSPCIFVIDSMGCLPQNARMALTTRQAEYREYLSGEHWESLRSRALERDAGACVICRSTEKVQVHHIRYREKWEDGQLEDVQTLCRKHHRLEHGLGPTDFEAKARELRKFFGHQVRPPIPLWRELSGLIECDEDVRDFGDLMFEWVMFVFSDEQELHKPNWWMDKERASKWKDRALDIRNSILERIK